MHICIYHAAQAHRCDHNGCAQVLATLQSCMFAGPAKSAGHAVRAAAAFFPAAAAPAILSQLSGKVVERLDEPELAQHSVAVTVIHALSELMRVCPSRVEAEATRLVEVAEAAMFPRGLDRMASAHSPAFAEAPAQVRICPAQTA